MPSIRSAVPAVPAEPLYLEAVLRPHASLGRGAFRVLLLLFGLMTLFSSMVFLALGAWPVAGFFGLDLVLLAFAFHLSYRRAREQREHVRLTAGALTIDRILGRRRVQWRFQPYWVRVLHDADDDTSAALRLTSHGRTIPIATLISAPERHAFAARLKAALARCTAPSSA